MIKNYKLRLILFWIICIILSFILLKSTFITLGDFKGYSLVGNFVMDGTNIYSSVLNTWPPFFSIVSVPIALLDNFNPYFVRFLWLLGSLWAMYKIIDITTRLSFNYKLSLPTTNNNFLIKEDKISFLSWIVLVPVLINLRHIWSNIGNIQINIYMLLFAMLSIYYYAKDKKILAAFILSFSISIKVYTIFLFFYFIIKREYKFVIFTLLFTLFFSLIPFLVFGFEQTIHYYSVWFKECVEPFASVNHKNQSFFSMMRSLLMYESPGLEGPLKEAVYVNIANMTINQVKLISYLIIGIMAILVIYLFRNKLKKKTGTKSFLEYSLILALIPILSPLSWKAFFIFLFPAYFINYLFIYQSQNQLSKKMLIVLKALFYTSIILTVFSSELFVGVRFSDIMEVYSSYTIGTILLAINTLIIYKNFSGFKVIKG